MTLKFKPNALWDHQLHKRLLASELNLTHNIVILSSYNKNSASILEYIKSSTICLMLPRRQGLVPD